jgi:hypothetical protein
VFSRTGTLAPALVALFVCGLMIGAINTAISPLLLNATPQHMLGRVVAVINPAQRRRQAESSPRRIGRRAPACLIGHHRWAGLDTNVWPYGVHPPSHIPVHLI